MKAAKLYRQDFAETGTEEQGFNVGAIYRVTDWAGVNALQLRSAATQHMFGVSRCAPI